MNDTRPLHVRRAEAPRLHSIVEVEAARLYATQWLPAIERTLRGVLDRQVGPGDLFRKPLEYVLDSGGKRFRPLLTLASCELVGGDPNLALEAACAIEYLHTSSLLLDDLPCMDGAVARRGCLPLHQVIGEADTILVSLLLFNSAHDILARVGPADSNTRERFHRQICRLLGPEGMIGGQQVDLWAARGVVLLGGVEQDELRLRKTSALITAALLAGAQVGFAGDAEMQYLERFGRQLGEAYQLADDAHDAEEDRTRRISPEYHIEQAYERLQNAVGTLEVALGRSAALQTITALAVLGIQKVA